MNDDLNPLLSTDELLAESAVYARDREGVEDLNRVEEVALAYRDGYRRALGDVVRGIRASAGPSFRDGYAPQGDPV